MSGGVKAGLIAGGVLVAVLLVVAVLVGWGDLPPMIRAAQKSLQSALAGAVRQVGRGDPGAWASLLTLCFSYGFIHAAGPGHGKVLLVGYTLANRVQTMRFAAVTLISGLTQAGVAVALVAVIMGILGLARARTEGIAATILSPLGALILGALGLWLAQRGLARIRRLVRTAPPAPKRTNGLAARHLSGAQGSDPTAFCPDCGVAHGPDPHAVAMAKSRREMALLILGVAIRPCSGALFLLAITFQLGLAPAGIAGTFAMGLGTAMLNLALVLPASMARDRVLALVAPRWLAPVMAGLEVLAGVLVIFAALVLARMPA
jgi:nickel/cobalt exporter